MKALPKGLVLTETEREYFEGEEVWRDEHSNKRSWSCERVELNAFTAPALIDYVTEQLQAAGVRGKVIPPQEVVAEEARQVYEGDVQTLVDDVIRKLIPIADIERAVIAQFRDRLPWNETRTWVEETLAEQPTSAWRTALQRRVREALDEVEEEITSAIEARVRAELADDAEDEPAE